MNEVEAQQALAALREIEQRQFNAQESERMRLVSASDRELAAACRTWLDHCARRWRHEGYIRGHHVEASTDRPGCTIISLDTWRGTLRYYVWEDEIRMGGLEGFQRLLERIGVELGIQHERDSLSAMTATEVRARQAQTYDQMRQLMMAVNPPMFIDPAMLRGDWSVGPDYEAGKKAEQKAKDLFCAVAGKGALEILEVYGGYIVLTGSAGGKYRLYKRASFCVERVKDGAPLCAVVPEVPLWDHLLGIKLMIEHDEPRFLLTANSSLGFVQSGTGATITYTNHA